MTLRLSCTIRRTTVCVNSCSRCSSSRATQTLFWEGQGKRWASRGPGGQWAPVVSLLKNSPSTLCCSAEFCSGDRRVIFGSFGPNRYLQLGLGWQGDTMWPFPGGTGMSEYYLLIELWWSCAFSCAVCL